jgi:hypothetical protein
MVQRLVEQVAVLDNSCRYPQMTVDWFINIACTRQLPQRRLNQFVPEIVIIFSSGYEQLRPTKARRRTFHQI